MFIKTQWNKENGVLQELENDITRIFLLMD